MTVFFREYDPETDRAVPEALWRSALAPTWPVLPAALNLVRNGLVAVDPHATPVGFIAVDARGSVPLLLVDPAHRRRGLGTALLERALDHLRRAGTDEVRAGSGGEGYIWPGVPLDLPDAVAFFSRRGWVSDYDCLDLTLDLADYRPPDGSYDRSRRAGVITAPEPASPPVTEFETVHFPQWARHFHSGGEHILVARDRDGRIVGTLLYDGPGVGTYLPMLDARAGTIGCVGVIEELNNRGIGSAMVAHASEILRDAGTGRCHIGWAVRESFYGRVGYRPWRRYRMFRTSGR